MKKKLLAIIAALMAVTCSGCGNKAPNSTQNPPASPRKKVQHLSGSINAIS